MLASAILALAMTCDGTCIAQEDMDVILAVLEQKRCQLEEAPEITLDPITIIVDKDGRIYTSGNGPRPYKVRIDWCGYEIEGEGQVPVVAAVREEPTWGFRFRPKATVGVLPFASNGRFFDAGLLVEPFHVSWVNVNGYVGVQSVGGGIGVDVTTNFGGYVGYSLSYSGNPGAFAGAYFAF